eukprot:COSAG01_NODE_27802_length_676_cov_1.861352_1_plen_60_part_10
MSTLFQAGEATRAELVQLQMEQVSALEAEVADLQLQLQLALEERAAAAAVSAFLAWIRSP